MQNMKLGCVQLLMEITPDEKYARDYRNCQTNMFRTWLFILKAI